MSHTTMLYNGTVLHPFAEAASSFIEAQLSSPARIALLALVNVPLLVIAINVLLQLVSFAFVRDRFLYLLLYR